MEEFPLQFLTPWRVYFQPFNKQLKTCVLCACTTSSAAQLMVNVRVVAIDRAGDRSWRLAWLLRARNWCVWPRGATAVMGIFFKQGTSCIKVNSLTHSSHNRSSITVYLIESVGLVLSVCLFVCLVICLIYKIFINWRAQFQNQINPLLMKIEFLTLLYRITLELVTEWNLDPDNSRKYIFFLIYILFSHRHVYKFCPRNLFFSEVPKVDLFDFGTKLFHSTCSYKECYTGDVYVSCLLLYCLFVFCSFTSTWNSRFMHVSLLSCCSFVCLCKCFLFAHMFSFYFNTVTQRMDMYVSLLVVLVLSICLFMQMFSVRSSLYKRFIHST